MTPKEYLNQAYYIDRRIKMTIAKAEKMRASITYKSPTFENQLSAFQTRESLKTRKLKVRENYNRKEKIIS